MAAAILIACELPAGRRQRDRIMPVAARLASAGRRITVALRNPATAPASPGWSAVTAPAWRALPPPGFVASSYADLLLGGGYATPDALRPLLRDWLGLLDRVRPDLVIADHAPTALLAARNAGVPAAALGDGFALPPASHPLAPLRPWLANSAAAAASAEGRALAVVNAVQAAQGNAALPWLAELFAGLPLFLCTFPELDHYESRGEAEYFGEIFPEALRRPSGTSPGMAEGRQEQGGALSWPPNAGERVLVRVDPRRPLFPALMEALDSLGLPAIAQVNPAHHALAAPLARGRVQVVTGPVDRDAVIAGASIVICQDSRSAVPALLAGRPVLLAPRSMAQTMILRRLARQRLGHGLLPRADAAASAAAVRGLLDDPACRTRAAGFASAYAGYRPALAIEAVVQECVALTGG